MVEPSYRKQVEDARLVALQGDDTVADFLAKFQTTASALQPNGRIKLQVTSQREDNMEFVRAVLSDKRASKICALEWEYLGKQANQVFTLDWWYYGMQDVSSIGELITNSCPDLVTLAVRFEGFSAVDFVSSILEQPTCKVACLELFRYSVGDFPRLFKALEQGQVTQLDIDACDSPEFLQGLFDFLAKDLLTKLAVSIKSEHVLPSLTASLAKCTRLTELRFYSCKFGQQVALACLPQSIVKLELTACELFGDTSEYDWSFVGNSNVQELTFFAVDGVNGKRLGQALFDCLRTRELKLLRIDACDFAKQTMDVLGLEVARLERLDLEHCNLDEAYIEQISLALQSSDCGLRELLLHVDSGTANGLEIHLLPALRHPNCVLTRLHLLAPTNIAEYKTLATRIHTEFAKVRQRRTVLVLLQARKRNSPLKRLPVEVFRLVGNALVYHSV
ncbi:hypothetical protein BASA81_005334 [Batrachochytrium salamandrivorans]|nr:hypothetical protein BASA81_005334 [Batrachochytrium salamandrivorans]